MASRHDYDNTGSGVTPRLGVGKPDGLARPGGGGDGAGGVSTGSDMIPRAARPGSHEGFGDAAGAGGVPSVARPGGPEGANK